MNEFPTSTRIGIIMKIIIIARLETKKADKNFSLTVIRTRDLALCERRFLASFFWLLQRPGVVVEW